MKKLHKLLVGGALSALLLLSTACERNAEPDFAQLGWEYYPLNLGDYRIYDVHRINYTFSNPEEPEILEYELLEKVADYYLNQTNDTIYVLHRLRRYADTEQWVLDSAYNVQRSTQRLVLGVNNRPQVQLIFPVAEGKRWNSNLLNAAEEVEYKMLNVGKPFNFANSEYFSTDETVYDRSLLVDQKNLEDDVLKIQDIRQEVYAHNIGLVYKLVKQLQYCNASDCTSGSVTSGNFLEMKLKESGTDLP